MGHSKLWLVLPPAQKARPVRGQEKFRDYDPGYVHIDVKHLPKLQTSDGERRKRFLYVAIDRCSRSVHLAVYDSENAYNSIDFLKAVKTAFPFRITHILTDHGSCFTADAFEKAYHDMGIDRRRTKAYSPQTNGMVERFNGRVATEVLPICVSSHKDLVIPLRGFCFAYNHHPQRVLDGITPAQCIMSWLFLIFPSPPAEHGFPGEDAHFPGRGPSALQALSDQSTDTAKSSGSALICQSPDPPQPVSWINRCYVRS
jgi:hypothetical protein